MANTIKIKRSSTTGNVPTTSQIAQGELAINTTDQKLFSSDGSAVFELTGGSTGTTYTAGTNVSISAGDVISSTDTNTTYSGSDFLPNKRGTVTGVSNAGWTTAFKVNGQGLGASISFSAVGTANSVVVSNIVDIIVNHSVDIFITSQSGSYTQLSVKVVSDNNDDFVVQLKTSSATTTSLDIDVQSLNRETITFQSTNPYTGATLEHDCKSHGFASSSSGGNAHEFYSNGTKLVAANDNQALHDTDALSISGQTLTLKKGDASTETVTLPDTNTWRSISDSTSTTSSTVSASQTAVKAAFDIGNHSHPYLGSTATAADSQKLDGLDSTKFTREIGTGSATVGGGWITVAKSNSGRHRGEVIVSDAESGDHAYIRIEWMRSYADSNFTVLTCGGHANRITGARVFYETADITYGWQLLQVYVTVSSNYRVQVFEPAAVSGWSGHTVVTPIVQNTITGYAVHGSELTGLETYSLASEEGIKAGGVIAATGGNSTNWNTAHTHSQAAHAPSDANNYSHPIGAGSNHVPSGGSAGQFLKYSSSGVATWATPSYTTNTDTTYTAGTNVSISGANVISSTDTDTTYSVGDGGLTTNNFTTTLKNKLDNITGTNTGDDNQSVATTTISSTSDLSSLGNYGWYQWSSSVPTSAPGAYGVLLNIEGNQDQQLVQIYKDTNEVRLLGRRKTSGTWDTSWTEYWSDKNDGSGSGLDADLLDGLHASSFLQTSVAPTLTGSLTSAESTGGVTLTWAKSADTVDYYEAWSSVTATDDHVLIGKVLASDITGSTVSLLDDGYETSSTTIYYRVLAVNKGQRSNVLSGSLSVSNTAADPTNMNVVPLTGAYYVQYDIPNDPKLANVTVKKYAAATAALADNESSATVIYTGDNNSYMFTVPSGDSTKYHKFWVTSNTRT